uniref:ZP domain-containing protein n=1 Tax=Poecilia mexicana TaxID=48701 RepID=A0A3B3Y8U0_9TELE
MFKRFLSALLAAAGSHQAFTSSAEMNISSCPITYYGQKYEKVYVNRFAVCFKGLYQPGIQNDCILMSGGTADRGGLSVLSREIPTGSGVHKLLPNLKYAGKCVNVIPLTDSQQSQVTVLLEQRELGGQPADGLVLFTHFSGILQVADAQVNGLTVSKQTFQTSETNSGVITDVSGCRFSGLAYETNTTVNDPRICCTVTCDVSGAATAVSHCGPMEHCQGDGSCAMNAVCSVTGSTVIGFTSRPQSVPDRCGYSLLRSSSLPGLHVLGIFKERRRKDLSFLDRVVLQLDREGAQISLEQGSKVKVNDDFLTVHATPQMVHSVALTKSHAGVTAKLEASNYTVSVVFDGQTAIIHLTGKASWLKGLCGDSSSAVNEQKSSEYSDTEDTFQSVEHSGRDVHYTVFLRSVTMCGSSELSFIHQLLLSDLITANNSQIIYKNAIMTQNISMFGLITRHDKVHMDFSCYYSQPDVKTLSIRFRQSSVIQHISSGEWKYNLTMEAYTSRDRTKPIDSDADIDLNQRLWVELKTYGLEEDRVAVVTDSCWATDRPSPAGGLRYNLIINGCPNPKDPTVAVEGNGLGTSTVFSFNTFQFTGSSGNVFLHCKVELCVRQGDNCIQRCAQTARGRRSARPEYETVNLAFISVAWTY